MIHPSMHLLLLFSLAGSQGGCTERNCIWRENDLYTYFKSNKIYTVMAENVAAMDRLLRREVFLLCGDFRTGYDQLWRRLLSLELLHITSQLSCHLSPVGCLCRASSEDVCFSTSTFRNVFLIIY